MDKVMCPYCGAEMVEDGKFRFPRVRRYWYTCPGERCGVQSPYRRTPDEALTAAMQRYQPENRVLGLEEVLAIDPDGALCIEDRKSGEIEVILNREILEEFAEVVRDGGQDAAKEAYGRFSRAWLRRPTDAEREEVAWG